MATFYSRTDFNAKFQMTHTNLFTTQTGKKTHRSRKRGTKINDKKNQNGNKNEEENASFSQRRTKDKKE